MIYYDSFTKPILHTYEDAVNKVANIVESNVIIYLEKFQLL